MIADVAKAFKQWNQAKSREAETKSLQGAQSTIQAHQQRIALLEKQAESAAEELDTAVEMLVEQQKRAAQQKQQLEQSLKWAEDNAEATRLKMVQAAHSVEAVQQLDALHEEVMHHNRVADEAQPHGIDVNMVHQWCDVADAFSLQFGSREQECLMLQGQLGQLEEECTKLRQEVSGTSSSLRTSSVLSTWEASTMHRESEWLTHELGVATKALAAACQSSEDLWTKNHALEEKNKALVSLLDMARLAI